MTNLNEIREELIALEKLLFTAEVRRSKSQLQALIADEFQEIGASGYRFGKGEVLERLPLEVPPKITSIDFELVLLAQNCAQLIYRSKMFKHGEDGAFYSQRCSIWRRNGELWQMIFHQGTPCRAFDERC